MRHERNSYQQKRDPRTSVFQTPIYLNFNKRSRDDVFAIFSLFTYDLLAKL